MYSLCSQRRACHLKTIISIIALPFAVVVVMAFCLFFLAEAIVNGIFFSRLGKKLALSDLLSEGSSDPKR